MMRFFLGDSVFRNGLTVNSKLLPLMFATFRGFTNNIGILFEMFVIYVLAPPFIFSPSLIF